MVSIEILLIKTMLLYKPNCTCETLSEAHVCERLGSAYPDKIYYLLLKSNEDGTYTPDTGYVKLVCE
jgi:hypothetical protein